MGLKEDAFKEMNLSFRQTEQWNVLSSTKELKRVITSKEVTWDKKCLQSSLAS